MERLSPRQEQPRKRLDARIDAGEPLDAYHAGDEDGPATVMRLSRSSPLSSEPSGCARNASTRSPRSGPSGNAATSLWAGRSRPVATGFRPANPETSGRSRDHLRSGSRARRPGSEPPSWESRPRPRRIDSTPPPALITAGVIASELDEPIHRVVRVWRPARGSSRPPWPVASDCLTAGPSSRFARTRRHRPPPHAARARRCGLNSANAQVRNLIAR
jgi:hypothetical protein